MKIHNNNLKLNGTDMTSNIISDPIYVGNIINYSIQLVYTGSPNGSFSIQVSNDIVDSIKDVKASDIVNWTTLSSTSTNITSSGDMIYEIPDITYQWIRLVWTDSSSGDPSTLTNAVYFTKGI
jgi:hypothetical protein